MIRKTIDFTCIIFLSHFSFGQEVFDANDYYEKIKKEGLNNSHVEKNCLRIDR